MLPMKELGSGVGDEIGEYSGPPTFHHIDQLGTEPLGIVNNLWKIRYLHL